MAADTGEGGQVIVTALYNLAIVAGCVYLVGWCGWSAWWFLLAAVMMASWTE